MKKILVDLKFAATGYSGMPQDSRLMLKTFATLPDCEPSGLVWALGASKRSKSKARSLSKYQNVLREADHVLNVVGEPVEQSRYRILRILARLENAYDLLTTPKFELSELDREYWFDFVWRELLSKTLDPSDQEILRSISYFYTSLDWALVIRRAMVGVKMPRLDTTGFDFALFQDSSPVSISPGTRKIIRYHDAIPLIRPELVGNSRVYSRFHAYGIAACSHDSFFVCNSEPTRQDLVSLFPELERRSAAIPYALVENKRTLAPNALPTIARTRLSLAALDERGRGSRRDIEGRAMERIAQPYLLTVSTLEPRKNYVGLVRAWERMRYQTQRDIPLVIVGNRGWKYDPILAVMRPHVEEGSIIHLESVSIEELRILYSHAIALVSGSLYEGFGFPPMEAMQCGCPTIVSDIAAHKWVMGDAPAYFSPYDLNAMAAAMERVTDPEADGLRQDMAAKGLERTKLYTVPAVAPQWAALLDRLSSAPS